MHATNTDDRPLQTAVNHNYYDKWFLDYVLLPYGVYYAPENHAIKAGGEMRFMTGERVEVMSVLLISTTSPTTDILCQMKYGIPITVLMQVLTDNATITGEEEQISQDEIFFVSYKPYVKKLEKDDK